MNRILIPAWIMMSLLFFSCTKDNINPASDQETKLEAFVKSASPSGKMNHWILPETTDLENIPQEPKNPLTETKVELGRLLFYETAFANSAAREEGIGTYSCSTCHIPSAGFRPGSKQGIADGGVGYGTNGEDRLRNTNYLESEMDVQGARPISMLNVAFVGENTMWNGSFGSSGVNIGTEDRWVGDFHNNTLGLQGIEAQNIEGMVTHKFLYNYENIVENGYLELFDASFPEVPEEERYNNKIASFALSAYIRTLFSNEAPFQKWLHGNKQAMSYEEKEGAILFFGKAGCTNCHKGPGFATIEFHGVGAKDMYQQPSFKTSANDLRNMGRGGFTGKAEDMFKFKVPQLYNMSDTEFYFHGASHTTIKSVVKYFNLAIPENPNVPQEQLSPYFIPLNLTDSEVDKLTLFLEKSLRDPNLNRYMPEEVLSGSCFPNADFQSSMDIGCF